MRGGGEGEMEEDVGVRGRGRGEEEDVGRCWSIGSVDDGGVGAVTG